MLPLSRVAAATVLAAALLPAARADDEVKPLRFAWPVPGSVRVSDKTSKSGHDATIRYVVTLTRVEGTTDVRLHLSDTALVDLDGHPASDPALAQVAALMAALSAAQPDLVLTAEGRFKDVADVDKAIETAFAPLEATADEKRKAEIAKSRASLARPEARELMKREARAFWNAWVGDWVGLAFAAEEPQKTVHAIRGPDGTDFDGPTTVTRKTSEAGRVQLLRTTALDADQAKTALDGWVKKVTEVTKKAPPEGHFAGLSCTERVLAHTDPTTLRPARVIRETKVAIRLRSGEEKETVERHEYTFDWTP